MPADTHNPAPTHARTHTHTHTHTQTYTVHTNTQPPQTCVCMCVHELVCVRVCLGVCYICVCLLFTRQKHDNVRVVLETSHLTREIFFLTMYDVEDCHICDLTIVWKNACQSKTSQPNRDFLVSIYS